MAAAVALRKLVGARVLGAAGGAGAGAAQPSSRDARGPRHHRHLAVVAQNLHRPDVCEDHDGQGKEEGHHGGVDGEDVVEDTALDADAGHVEHDVARIGVALDDERQRDGERHAPRRDQQRQHVPLVLRRSETSTRQKRESQRNSTPLNALAFLLSVLHSFLRWTDGWVKKLSTCSGNCGPNERCSSPGEGNLFLDVASLNSFMVFH